jgi:uncharacterized protein (DUF1697 family)
MKTYIVLLRGVMPTGKNKVPMAALREALAGSGLVDVQTYIQSGNVTLRSTLGQVVLEKLVHDTIAQKIGADIAVVARTPTQLGRILANCPFAATDAPRLYFTLLASKPKTALLQSFEQTDFKPDAVQVAGSAIYTRYATQHSDSRFNNNFFERKLQVTATTRNFNTMTQLLAMCA